MFHPTSKRLKENSAVQRFITPLMSVGKLDETLFLVFDILETTPLKTPELEATTRNASVGSRIYYLLPLMGPCFEITCVQTVNQI